VFVFECITSARRWQLYATRALFVMGLLGAMVVIWSSQADQPGQKTARALAQLGENYFYALIGTQLALVLLAAPAFTAGTICLDRTRGALAHVMVTDLTDTEIVLGKLGAGLMPVLGLVVCALPVMSLGTMLGGMDPVALTLAFLVAIAVAILGCVLALTFSVWAARTYEVMMAVYAFWTLDLLLYPLWFMLARSGAGIGGPPQWTLMINPFWLSFAPYVAPNQVSWTDFALFIGGALLLSIGLTVVSTVRLRPVTASLPERSIGGKKVRSRISFWARLSRLLPGPSLDGNPVLWREWHRSRPSRLTWFLWWMYFTGLSYGGASSVADICANGVSRGPSAGPFVILLGIGLGLLLLSVMASTSLSEERARGTLDVLLTTPLPTPSVVWGKWWGTFRVVPFLAFWPTVVMAAFAYSEPVSWPGRPPGFLQQELTDASRAYTVVLMALIILVHGAAITSLGLALATWISRPSRAVGLCVVVYALVSVGWIILVLVLFEHGPRDTVEQLGGLSPIFAAITLCEETVFRPHNLLSTLASTTVWLVVVAGMGVFLYALTLATFNRCLGRITEGRDDFEFGPERPPNWGQIRPAKKVLASYDDPAL
jgi:ABC-type transport system involved in multi-copper enzyme maturation permease subunit